MIHLRTKQYKKAILQFNKVLKTHHSNIPAYCNLVNALTQSGKVNEAKKVVDRALNLQPSQLIENRMLAGLAYQEAELNKAEQFYRRALELQPNDHHSLSGIGNVLR